MLLDEMRVIALSRHFHCYVVSFMIIVTVEQMCTEFVSDVHSRNMIINAVQGIVLKNPPNPTAPRHTIRLVMEELATNLSVDQLSTVQIILEKNVKKTSTVYAPMTNMLKRMWFHLIKDNEIPEVCHVPTCTRFLVAEMQKYSSSLAAVVVLNKNVHVKRYNEMITNAAKVIDASIKCV